MSANFRKYYLKPCPITKFGIIAHVLPLTAHCSRLIAHVLASLLYMPQQNEVVECALHLRGNNK